MFRERTGRSWLAGNPAGFSRAGCVSARSAGVLARDYTFALTRFARLDVVRATLWGLLIATFVVGGDEPLASRVQIEDLKQVERELATCRRKNLAILQDARWRRGA